MRARATASNWLPVAVLIVLGVLSMGRQWGGEILWETDGLFYQARVEQVRGQEEQAALRSVFSGPLSARARRIEATHEELRRVRDPAWPLYSQRFYERRWLVPLTAAGAYPLLGEHSLETLSLLGYVLVAPLLFMLLRQRFRTLPSLLVAGAVVVLAPLRDWSIYPLTDSLGLVLLIAGFLAALAVYRRGLRWLPLWLACVLALSFTRDTAFILVISALVVLLVNRDRKSAALALGGIAAALPAPLLFSVGLREQLAYVFSDHTEPTDTSWGFVLGEYLPHLGNVADRYLDYAASNPAVIAFFVVGLFFAFALGPRRDPFFVLLRASLLGYLLMLVIGPTFSIFRYELVLVPLAGCGLALGAEWAAALVRRTREERVPMVSKNGPVASQGRW